MASAGYDSAFVRHYDRLARVAYVIGAGRRSRRARWRDAHRVVARALPGRRAQAPGEADLVVRELLVRVVRRGLRGRRLPRFGGLRIGRLGRAVTPPGTPAHTALDAALAAAPPVTRAAYALVIGEGMGRKEATWILRDAKIDDPATAITAAYAIRDGLRERGAGDALAQHDLVNGAPMDPCMLKLAPPRPGRLRWSRRVRRVGVLAVCAAVFLGPSHLPTAAHTTKGPQGAANASGPVVRAAPAGAWESVSVPSIDTWPARGTRTGDGALSRIAVRAWQGTQPGVRYQVAPGIDPAPPSGLPQLLYSGDLDGRTVVLLSDRLRLATYVDDHHTRTMTVSPAPRRDPRTAAALRLTEGRYLVAPWVSSVETGGLSGGFAPLPITGGVTDKAPVAGKVDAACWSGTVLRVKAHDIGTDAPFTLGDTGHAALARLTYVGPTAAADLDRPEELDSAAGTAAWSRLGCALGDLRTATSDSLTAWEFWAGRLPESGPAARWICVRGEMADGRNAAFGQFAPAEPAPVQATGAVLGSRLCGPLSRDLAAATWWRAPSGQWYLLVAGSRNVRTIEVVLGTARAVGRGLVPLGPFKNPPADKATVRAVTATGAAVPVLAPADPNR